MAHPPSDAAPDRALSGAAGRLLVLFALTGFAISQPLLSVLGANPTVFTFHKVTGWTIVWIALAIALVPPLALWGLELAASALSPGLGRALHLGFVGLLAALTVVQVAKAAGASAPWLVAPLALAAGAGFALAYHRIGTVATWVRFASPLPLLAVGLFVLSSPTSTLLTTPSRSPEPVDDGRDRPPVVVVMLDELPTLSLLDERGAIDPVRFPNLAAFADDATWYRRYTSLAPYTTAAVPSALTSTEPVDAPPVWSEHPDNLFTLLAPTHDLAVFESLTFLCGLEQCTGPDGAPSGVAFEPRLGELLRQIGQLWRDRISLGDDEVERLDDFEERLRYNPNALAEESELNGLDAVRARPERLEQFLASLEDTAARQAVRPSFHYLHLLLPHHPWRFYADGQVYDPPLVPDVPQLYPFHYDNAFGPWVAALTEERHLQQTQYTDLLLGDVLDTLRRTGAYDESVIVITADHGASFRPDEPMREATQENVADLAYVPLLIKDAHQRSGAVDDSNLSALDLVPTIAELVDVQPDWEVGGSPAGSSDVAARSGEKRFIDFRGGIGERELHGVLTFDDARERPLARHRSIEPPTVAWAPILGLYRAFGLDHHLGKPPPTSVGDGVELVAGAVDGDRGRAGDGADVAEGAADVETVEGVAGGRGPRVAEVAGLDSLRRPPTDAPPPGLVTGRVEGAPDTSTVLAVIDGVVRAASPVYAIDGQDGWFAALLPAGTLGPRNDIGLVLLDDDRAVELELTSR